jgi:hypothetical protein
MRFIEEDNEKSAIGSGLIDIYHSADWGWDSLSVLKRYNPTSIYVAKDMNDANEYCLTKDKPCLLVVKGPRNILWALPVISGFLVHGMWGGSFVYTSNSVVMKGESSPIHLMDRLE